jgi:hypothetical protein
MIVPSLTALFTNATRQMGSNHGPLFGAMFLNQIEDLLIFLCGPWSLDQFRLEHFLPTM